MKNKIVLIGANNYNGLGLVRSFGENGILPYGIIIGREKKGFVEKSKYWKQVWFVDDAENVLDVLMDNFSKEEARPVIIPYADKVVQIFDDLYDTLSQYFILSNINEEKGAINAIVNKFDQVSFAQKLGFAMLESRILSLMSVGEEGEKKFPLILKPVQGGEGDKHDISICNNQKEYVNAVERLQAKGYQRILEQNYLQDREEYVIFGAMDKQYNFCSYTVLRNIRQYPSSYGIGCFSEYITDDHEVYGFAKELMIKIMQYGYNGSIDIELFKSGNGEIYINEINWRVGGRNFTALDTKNYSTVWWALLQCGEKIDFSLKNIIHNRVGYSMKETEDIKNVLFKQISLKSWCKDLRKTTSFAVRDKKDKKPVQYLYYQLLKKFLLKRG